MDSLPSSLGRWRLRLAESQLWAVRCGSGPDAVEKLGEAFATDCDTTANAIEKLRRWWQGNERHLNRCEERLRLMKTLRDAGAYGKARAGTSPTFSRFMDAVIARPLPGEIPAQVAAQFDDSAEQTQSHHSQGDQQDAPSSEAGAPSVSQLAVPAPEPRNRAERRRLFRAQRKVEKRARTR